MPSRPSLLLTALCAAALGVLPKSVHASQIYKCKLPTGVVSFQEKPCARGTHLKTIVVPTVPPAAGKPVAVLSTNASVPPPPGSVAPPAAASPSAVPPAAPPLAMPPAPYYRCTRADGSNYYTGSPVPRRYEAAAASVTDPSVSLGPASAGMVWMEERCAEVPLSEACAHYQQQLDFVLAQQRVLSGADLKKSTQEQQRLTTIRSARCRGL